MQRHVQHVDAEVDQRPAARHSLLVNQLPSVGMPVAAHPARLGVVDAAQATLVDVPLEDLTSPRAPVVEDGVQQHPLAARRRDHRLGLGTACAPVASRRDVRPLPSAAIAIGAWSAFGVQTLIVEVVARQQILIIVVQIGDAILRAEFCQPVHLL